VPSAPAETLGPGARLSVAPWGALALLLAAAAAWAALATGTAGMDSMAAFLPAWSVMMAAMMLPAVTPVAALYARTLRAGSRLRLYSFAGGYLLVWALTALPAYAAWTGLRDAVLPHPLAARLIASGVFGLCGIYQLTPLKERCLSHCRSPLGLLMRYASYRGAARDLRAGAHHAGYCLGCCWALMLLLFAFGAMSLPAAAGLTAVVVAEKLSPWGRAVSRIVGVTALVLAVLVLAVPALAPGLAPMKMMTG
jgi:predicted metal-binding membrane protein